MTRVYHFELLTDDPERMKAFYKGLFDWKVEKWDGPTPYWFFISGDSSEHGIDGAFCQRQSTDQRAINTIGVDDIDKYVERIENNGGEIVRAKSAVPGVGWLVYFKDSEGNLWGLMQDDTSAK